MAIVMESPGCSCHAMCNHDVLQGLGIELVAMGMDIISVICDLGAMMRYTCDLSLLLEYASIFYVANLLWLINTLALA